MFLPALLTLAFLLIGATGVLSHGQITSHEIRAPGPKSEELCGKPFNDHFSGVSNGNDILGPIFPFVDGVMLPSTCQWYLCRGMRYEDNQANVYSFNPGEGIHLKFFVLARHSGTANVSVVDVARNEVIPGGQMKYWPSGYAAKKDRRFNHPDGFPPSDQVDFVVDMPDLGGRCAVPGECVIQHWWWGKDSARDQYFESCIDFVQPRRQTVDYGGDAQTVLRVPEGLRRNASQRQETDERAWKPHSHSG